MAFFQLVLKARKLEKVRRSYEDEKLTSIEISKGAKYPYTIGQRIRRKKIWFKKKVKVLYNKIFAVLKNSRLYKKYVAITTDGTLENYVAKSFFGFVGGIVLTYIFFIFFVFQLNFKLSSATFICTVLGAILTLGLAFSPRIRCIVFLILPQFFSKRGRQALMAYAFILALTGPVKNILHNTAVLSESLACAQQQLKEAVKSVIDLAKQPFYALRDAISKVIKTVKAVVKKIKQTLIAIKRVVLSILRVIKSVFQWLGSVINICNKKLGTPFDRCQRVFEGAVADCKAKLGPIIGVVCNITYVVSTLCYIVKPLDFICMLVSYIADSIVGTVRNKIKKFTTHMKAMFYVKIKFSHSFTYETNQSKTIQEVSTGIATEIRSRTDALFGFFDWISFLTSFFIFFILLRALRYRYKWLTSERFDNRYITNDLRTIDLIRTRQDKETVLPLNPRERNRYVPLSSVMLLKSERIKLARSAVFLGLATIKFLAYMSIDYSLYWVLNAIQVHGRFQSKVEQPSVVSIHVSGNGYLAELYRSIAKAFTPHGKEGEVDTLLCLPDPIPPNLDKYAQIIILVFMCWLMAFFEPYGLRLRHVVLCQYYPDRAKQRAAWLYNHIIRSRGSFLKFARRQLRRKFGLTDRGRTEKVTLRERLWATFPCLNIFFPLKQNVCLLCGAVERSDDQPHIKCPTPGCVGLFCVQCYADLQNLCTICRSPIEYGDLTDMSEEKDSSEDQFEMPKIVPPKPESREDEAESKEDEEPSPDEGDEKEETTEEEVKEEEETEPPIAEEEKEEPIKKEKDAAEQTDEKYVEDLDESSESAYSYTYQDESPDEMETGKRRERFKDVEAQRIRDDVTIQIFNEPLARESCSSSESPTSSFVVRARRKVSAKLKKRPDGGVSCAKDSDSSTSIADTESWSSEEIDEEEVIHIEVDDGSEELLPKDRKDKAKLGRINRIVGAVARIPWLGKGEDNREECRRLYKRRPSLMNRIVSMLQRKQSMPVQSYRRIRKLKDSLSSSSCSCDDENEGLLRKQDKENRCLTRRKRRKRTTEDESDEMESLGGHSYEKRFTTKQLPRRLESTAKDTRYFEVDETEDLRGRKCVRQVKDISELPGTRAHMRSKRRDAWDTRGPGTCCTCSSEITFETTEAKDTLSPSMRTISEQIDSTLKLTSETEAELTSKSETDYSKEIELPIKTLKKQKHMGGESSKYEKSKDLKETEGDLEKKEEKNTVTEKGEQKFTKEEVKKSVAPKKMEEDVAPAKEIEDKSNVQEDKTTVSRGAEISQLYDTVAGLELYGVGHETKRKKVKYTRQEVATKEKVAESEVQDSKDNPIHSEEEPKPPEQTPTLSKEKPKLPEEKLRLSVEKHNLTEENPELPKEEPTKADDTNRKLHVDSQDKKIKIDKATDLPDKSRSTQTKFHKRTEQDAKTSHTKRSRKVAKKSSNENKKEKRSREKRELRKRYKTDRGKSHTSKKKTCSCSNRSTFTEDEELCSYEHRPKPKKIEETVDTEEWEPYEDMYSAHECQCCTRNYDTDICRSSVLETPRGAFKSGQPEITTETFEMPVLKKYLPMYQSPELIDELKRHDRIRLIQEEEARRLRIENASQSSDFISVCSKREDKKTVRTGAPIVPLAKQEDRLPYQETKTYKNVLRELQKRTRKRRSRRNEDDSAALIQKSKRADRSKKVEQLYPREAQDGNKSTLMKRLSHKIIAPFKPAKKPKCKDHTANTAIEQMGALRYDYSYSPEVMSDISSSCDCVKQIHIFDTSTSADEGTDNE